GVTVVAPWLMIHSSAPGTAMPVAALLALIVPVGTITFAIWAVYAAARWGANKPSSERRGVLKWVFIALLLAGIGFVVTIVPARRSVSYPPTPVVHVGNSVGELSFGPVHETVLPEPGPGVACLLDFETGNLLTPSD